LRRKLIDSARYGAPRRPQQRKEGIMPQTQNIFEEGIDRVESALKDVEKDWKRFQKQAEKRRKEIEKRAETRVKKLQAEVRKNPLVKRAEKRRQDLEKRAEKARAQFRKNPAVVRAEALRKDAEKAINTQVDGLLGNLRIANADEFGRLERKVNALNRKVRELEKATVA
jgi:t-SNARE complex subunit (syntaxin)